jgi:hypothetical protein
VRFDKYKVIIHIKTYLFVFNVLIMHILKAPQARDAGGGQPAT